MKGSAFSIKKIAPTLISVSLLVYILSVTQFILAPITFGVLITLLLFPVQNRIEKVISSRFASTSITLLLVTLVLLGIITVFSFQLVDVFQNMPAISSKLKTGFQQLISWVHQNFGLTRTEGIQWLKSNFSNLVDAPMKFFKQGITSSTSFIFNLFLTFISVFFFMVYKTPIKKFILHQFSKKSRKEGINYLDQIQHITRQYLTGLLIVILILAALNTLGLWIIGIGYPFFFGSLAACMVIVPYFGTTIGGLIPFIYSIATLEFWWQPVAVIGMYAAIQQIEGTFITPNVIGSSVKVNFYTAFIALIIGGAIWGIAGVILSLPMMAMLKVSFEHINAFKPLSLLMSDDLSDHYEKFEKDWDEDQYRLSSLFKEEDKN